MRLFIDAAWDAAERPVWAALCFEQATPTVGRAREIATRSEHEVCFIQAQFILNGAGASHTADENPLHLR
jgi:hypothetical protein